MHLQKIYVLCVFRKFYLPLQRIYDIVMDTLIVIGFVAFIAVVAVVYFTFFEKKTLKEN